MKHLKSVIAAERKAVYYAGACFALAFLCFLPSLKCFFFADDFLCLEYLGKIFNGQPQLFLLRLFSPWQDHNVQLLYRPLGDVSLALDYLFWRDNAFGYHLTNVLLHAATSVLVFFLCRKLFKDLADKNLPSFLAAALFAAYPLHIENVVWIVGRLDILCTFFLLASFLAFICFLESSKTIYLFSGLLGFWLALLSKEMALILPFLLVAYLLLIAGKFQLKPLLPFMAVALIYMFLRWSVLGTLLGGYTGILGELYKETFLGRFLEFKKYFALFYPINRQIIPAEGLGDQLLHALYILCGLFLLARSVINPWSTFTSKRLLFALVWIFCTMLPALQVLDLTGNLSSARIFYLASIGMSMLIVSALYPFASTKFFMRTTACTLLSCLILLFSLVTLRCQEPWLHVSTMIKNLQSTLIEQVQKLPADKKLLLLNLATTYKGVHIFYEFAELKTLISQPFFAENYGNKLATVSWFSTDNSLNLTAFENEHYNHEIRRIHWIEKPELQKISTLQSKSEVAAMPKCSWKKIASKNNNHDYLVSLKRQIEPSSIAFVEIELASSSKDFAQLPQDLVFEYGDAKGNWKTIERRIQKEYQDKRKVYVLPLSEHLDWNLSGKCRPFVLRLAEDEHKPFELVSVKLYGHDCYPKLTAAATTIDVGDDGICRLRNNVSGDLFYDARRVPGAANVILEISKPRYLFGFFSNSARNTQDVRYAGSRFLLSGNHGRFAFSRALFPQSARYQIHVCAADSKGQSLGRFSDPLTFEIVSAQGVWIGGWLNRLFMSPKN
ncbi:MAG: hypothetical protein K2W82_05140 [Candidatus Obscuribacterales bacterium]|nr:hypothetical protein [Candidatus Obscuribacterales bacterium]